MKSERSELKKRRKKRRLLRLIQGGLEELVAIGRCEVFEDEADSWFALQFRAPGQDARKGAM
jgi:hypothetical protein